MVIKVITLLTLRDTIRIIRLLHFIYLLMHPTYSSLLMLGVF